MITNLLGSSVILMGSSVCKLFILGVALGNVLNLKSKYVLTVWWDTYEIRIWIELNTRISFPDLGHDFGLIQNVDKVCRMLTNLLGSSWSNLFTLEAALGNVLNL